MQALNVKNCITVNLKANYSALLESSYEMNKPCATSNSKSLSDKTRETLSFFRFISFYFRISTAEQAFSHRWEHRGPVIFNEMYYSLFALWIISILLLRISYFKEDFMTTKQTQFLLNSSFLFV